MALSGEILQHGEKKANQEEKPGWATPVGSRHCEPLGIILIPFPYAD
jgi:hypothetical protein